MPVKKTDNIFLSMDPLLKENMLDIDEACHSAIDCYKRGGKIMLCGNGGSSAQCDHAAAELMKSFEIKRPLDKSFMKRLVGISPSDGKALAEKLESGLPAISLSSNPALISAIGNDMGYEMVFAQQVAGIGEEKDVLVAISTSGNSENVIKACITAVAMNITVIGLTGSTGGGMKNYCDILINVPSDDTARIQELHLPVLHEICRRIEQYFYAGNQKK